MIKKEYIVDKENLIKEWDFIKNTLNPSNVTCGSVKKAWWICPKGHSYDMRIDHRNNGHGCPYCSGRKPIKGENDLMTVNPELCKEWNYKRNEIKPDEVSQFSNKKVWWICSKGHEWQAIPSNRINGNGCPYCSGRHAIEGKTDLLTTNPNLCKEWNYDKNKHKPNDYTSHSASKVWWKCDKGHEWQAKICNRALGNNCPYCSGRYAIKGETDLLTINPELCKEWNYKKNEVLPDAVTPSSEKKIWWICSKGHEWQASICNRNKGRGCPYCAGKRLIKNFNDLATIHPALAKQWNYKKNYPLTPSDIMSRVAKKVWWICPNCNYEWEAAVNNRVAGTGCPKCAGKVK